MNETFCDYLPVKDLIHSRLGSFRNLWQEGNAADIFAELVFCLLTPQSKARNCWDSVMALRHQNLLLHGSERTVADVLRRKVRFHNTKARRIVEARKQFRVDGSFHIKAQIGSHRDTRDAREWLVKNVKGLGCKEASHFLRNIGKGEDLAILDRHIMKNLKLLGVIRKIPASLSIKRYLEIEKKMQRFAEKVRIPASHLDLLLWYRETGEVFK